MPRQLSPATGEHVPADEGNRASVRQPQLQSPLHELVLAHRPLVGHIVREVLARLPNHVDRGDLLSAGLVALTTAARTWNEDRGVPFARFAAIRVRGAITDELRSLDWATRGVRSRARTLADARAALQSDLGRAPTREELEVATGLSRSEIDTSASDLLRSGVVSLDSPVGAVAAERIASSSADPAALLVTRESLGYLEDAIESLPGRLRFVVRGYFFEQRPMADLAEVLGVTSSRVSQLRSEAVRLLHAALQEPLHGEPTDSVDTIGPRTLAARQAYVDSVRTRSSMTDRLSHTNVFGEARPHVALRDAG